jgi:hypothetical protein
MGLFTDPKDQMKEYEKIYIQARDQFSIDKNPDYLQIQLTCLEAMRELKYNLPVQCELP